jgi:3-phosphoshikimate 1-carboxyvinyltransferase
VGIDASKVAALPAVRAALVAAAQAFSPPARPGGRRARHGHRDLSRRAAQGFFNCQRRTTRTKTLHKQLISKGNAATLDALCADLEARDARDMSRSSAPLKPAQDARLLDNSDLSIEESVDQVLGWWQGIQPF